MAQPMRVTSVNAPGFHGLNKQASNIDISAGFATNATNCIIDKYGRIGARKGYTRLTSLSADLVSYDLEVIGELIANDGTQYILAAGNGCLFKYSGGALVKLTYGGGGVAPSILANNWQIITLNGLAYFFQRGYDPLYFDPASSTTQFKRVSEHASYAATVPQCNTGVSAYGRLWVADTATDKNTVAFSDLLLGYKWTGGTSGTLNLAGVWPHGSDEIVSLAAHNNFLVIFGKRQTLIYTGAKDPSTMTLYDSIANVGCYSRDTVQNTGTDLLFLSYTGVRSLMRTIQEKSSPMRDLSKNVRDHLIEDLEQETLGKIRSCYSEKYSFYLLSLPQTKEVYVFDTRHQMEDGSSRVTTWDSIEPTALCVTREQDILLGKPGYLCEYSGYLDHTSTYQMKYYTGYMSFADGQISSILKKIATTVIGGQGQTIYFKYAFDYSTNFRQAQATMDTAYIAYYGVSMYNQPTSVYSTGVFSDIPHVNIGGAGKVVQFGFETVISGQEISIQRFDIYMKSGKIL